MNTFIANKILNFSDKMIFLKVELHLVMKNIKSVAK